MGTGGIIFLVIAGFWVVYLVPVLARERAARLENRDGDRSSAAVRVLERPAAQRPSHRVVLTADRPLVSDRMPARPTPDLAETLRRRSATDRLATRVRAWAALVGVVVLVATGLAAPFGAVPWWAPVAAVGWLGAVVVSGAVSAAGARRRHAPVRRTAVDLPPRARRVATEVFDARASRPAPPPASSPVAAPSTIPAGRATGVEAPRRAAVGEQGDGTWTPAAVPAPVYVNKPVSPRPPALPWSLPPVALGDAEPGRAATGPSTPPREQSGTAPAADDAAPMAEQPPERRSAAG
ncbi:hypothetical protein [Aquipuribacter sp. SD81]|uniref:hypothetical protein n=1 Tax=Aquipuribacter sp. SD81 TaxID=3127703 RepID=UPI0030194079